MSFDTLFISQIDPFACLLPVRVPRRISGKYLTDKTTRPSTQITRNKHHCDLSAPMNFELH